MKKNKPSFFHVNRCKKCHEQLTSDEVYRSSGTCPKCGAMTNGTIVDTYKVLCKKQRISPWWKFWAESFSFTEAGE